MELEFDVKVNAPVLYDYMLHHTYTSASGLIGTTVGALLVCGFFIGGGVIYLLIGGVILLYLPGSLWLKSKQQAALTPAFKEALHYRLDDEGITVSQNETSETTAWDAVYKAVSTKGSIIVYTSRVNAFLFPRKSVGDKKDQLIQIISTHVPPDKVKIRA